MHSAALRFTGRYAVAFAVTAKHYGVLARDPHPELECFSATTSQQLVHTPFEVILAGQFPRQPNGHRWVYSWLR
jgi:hypothetical protein